MAKLLISPEAKQDLLEIKEYISNELDSPIAAKNVTDKIIKQISTLSDFPKIGSAKREDLNKGRKRKRRFKRRVKKFS